jgi:hypothetical protein
MNVKPALRHAIATMLAFKKRERRLISQEDGVNNFGTSIRHCPWFKEERMPDNRLMLYLPFDARQAFGIESFGESGVDRVLRRPHWTSF